MRSIQARVGFAALRAGVRPPRANFLTRYKEQWFFKHLLSRLGITLVIDVGANDGRFGEGLRLMGYEGRIASFEPIVSEFDKLSRRARGCQAWEAHCTALGSETGIASFGIIEQQGTTFYSSFLAPIGAPPVTRRQEVEVQRLDAIWPRIVRPDDRVFLKIDTQGFDMKVLRGAGERLSEVRGVLTEMSVIPLYEGSPRYLESLSFLESKGFELLELRPIDHDNRGSVIEFDCFMARL